MGCTPSAYPVRIITSIAFLLLCLWFSSFTGEHHSGYPIWKVVVHSHLAQFMVNGITIILTEIRCFCCVIVSVVLTGMLLFPHMRSTVVSPTRWGGCK